MKVLISVGLAALFSSSYAELVAWFPLTGHGADVIRGAKGVTLGDARFDSVDSRSALGLGGKNGALFVPDSPQFALGPSFSVSVQVWIKSWPKGGTSPAGQIVFRGDDRSGLDNFSMNVGEDGFYTFYMNSPENEGAGVRVPAKLNCWQTLLGTFDSTTKKLSLMVDGFVAAEQYTPCVPVTKMLADHHPGLSIGNVQNPLGGCHNQPFNGFIRDVRLFNSVATWDEATKPVKVRSGS